MLTDLKYAVRSLLKTPWLTAVVVLTLALGIGANTAVFSWTRGVLLHPLRGVTDAQRLFTIETLAAAGGYIDSSWPDFRDYRDQSHSLAGVIAFHDRPLRFGADEQPRRVWAEFVSGNFFDVLGVKPLVGRFFAGDEQREAPGRHSVAVIGEKFWRQELNADPAVVGRTVRLNGVLMTVIGVAPKAFTGTIVGVSFDVWTPLDMQSTLSRNVDWLESRDARGLHLMARLKPGASFGQASAEIRAIGRQLSQAYPATNQGIGATLLPVRQAPYGVQSRIGSLLEILLGAGAVVLLVVCANVANLLLARGMARQQEFDVRLALGASRGRVIGQLLIESLLLSGLGAVAGVALATRMAGWLGFFIPATTYPIALDFPLDAVALAYTLSISVLTGLLFGSVPALQMIRPNRMSSLKDGGRGVTGGARSQRLRAMLVVSEVALALLALIGAGLFLHSFQHAKRIDPGFDPSNVLLAALNLSEQGYDRERSLLFLRQLRTRIEALPGVLRVSYSEDAPLGLGDGSWEEIQVEGYLPGRGEDMKVYRNPVAPGYFDLMRIPLVEGRDFTGRDDANSPRVVIVNQTFVRRFLARQPPIGGKLSIAGQQWTVVGVARDIKYQSLDESAQPYLYLPLEQFYFPAMGLGLHVRTAGPPESVLPALQRALRALDARVTLFETFTLSDYISAAWFAQKIAATLLSALGALALFLAALGLFSVMAYSVRQRTHEIGIRMALGAQPADIRRAVLSQALRLTLAGIALGLAASFALTPLITAQLLGVSAADPLTFIAVSLLLIAVSVAACWLPARRATKVDPLIALRAE